MAATTITSTPSVNMEESEERSGLDEASWRAAMLEILDQIDQKGDYCVSHPVDFPAMHPRIAVQGMTERLSFPLLEIQAQKLRELAVKAPYGKGKATVTDESVRKAWQIDAEKVTFEEPESWKSCLQKVVQSCLGRLGLTSGQSATVQANLYKMLLYEKGGHFQKHKDTEKEQGMFGTLVIQLPSKFSGGALVLQHNGERKTIDWSAESPNGFFATAFYADCEHELQPVTEGWRLCLIYNLVLPLGGTSSNNATTELPTAAAVTSQLQKLRTLATHWNNHLFRTDNSLHGYLLEGEYAKTNLGFSNLKRRDRQVSDFLREACDVHGKPLFVVALVLLEKREPESATCDDCYGGGYDGPCDNCSHVTDDDLDSSIGPTYWIGPDGEPMANFHLHPVDWEKALFLEEKEMELEGIFGDDPDTTELGSYTGNAGPKVEYGYYRSAIVFWPREKNLGIIAGAGLSYITSFLHATQDANEIRYVAKLAVDKIRNSHQVNAKLLSGVARAGDAPLMVQALQKITEVGRMGSTLVNILVQFQDSSIEKAVLALVETGQKYTIINGYIAFLESLEGNIAFLESLERKRSVLAHLFPTTGENIVKSGIAVYAKLENSMVVKLAWAAFRYPALFSDFIEQVMREKGTARAGLVVASLINKPEIRSNEQLQRLAQHRMKRLQSIVSKGEPKFSWRQKKKPTLTGNGSLGDKVNRFLASNLQEMTFNDFNGIDHARHYTYLHFGVLQSCRVQPGGTGQDGFVTLTKTKKGYETTVKRYKAFVAELARLSSVFGLRDSTTDMGRSCDTRTKRGQAN